ncbi:SLATT domain-containing protein [Micromonospora profundi]|uniref:SLATT domain-containing protein n=1 Tax=Micromonospora profundi TaxID=1420889 RepID=UPI00368D307E
MGDLYSRKRDARNLVPRSLTSAKDLKLPPTEVVIIFFWAEAQAIAAIEWYLRRKTSRSRWSKFFRAVTIFLGVLGSLVPLVHAATTQAPRPEWGFVLLAAAAGVLLGDRVFGFSSSWVRFMNTQAKLHGQLVIAQQEFLSWLARVDAEDSVAELHEISGRLSQAVNAGVLQETTEWRDDLVTQLGAASAQWEPHVQAPSPTGLSRPRGDA